MDLKNVFILNQTRYDVLILYERVLLYINSFEAFMLYILMYPVLNSTHMLDFLDTSSMGVTITPPFLAGIFIFMKKRYAKN
jgi:hypothetical protein